MVFALFTVLVCPLKESANFLLAKIAPDHKLFDLLLGGCLGACCDTGQVNPNTANLPLE